MVKVEGFVFWLMPWWSPLL